MQSPPFSNHVTPTRHVPLTSSSRDIEISRTFHYFTHCTELESSPSNNHITPTRHVTPLVRGTANRLNYLQVTLAQSHICDARLRTSRPLIYTKLHGGNTSPKSPLGSVMIVTRCCIIYYPHSVYSAHGGSLATRRHCHYYKEHINITHHITTVLPITTHKLSTPLHTAFVREIYLHCYQYGNNEGFFRTCAPQRQIPTALSQPGPYYTYVNRTCCRRFRQSYWHRRPSESIPARTSTWLVCRICPNQRLLRSRNDALAGYWR